MSKIKDYLTIIGAALVVVLILFISVIATTAMGAFIGWVLSFTFLGNWIIDGFAVFGIIATGKLTVIGALLGFLSGFFKTTKG